MHLNSILTPERTLCRTAGASKKRVIENVAHFISEDLPQLDADELFDQLVARERLGSTGLGQGIAIPHCRLKGCQNITGCLVTLEQGVDFESVDGQPVDIVFTLLVPDQAHDEHLQVLAKLAEKFSQADFCQALREAQNTEDLFAAATA